LLSREVVVSGGWWRDGKILELLVPKGGGAVHWESAKPASGSITREILTYLLGPGDKLGGEVIPTFTWSLTLPRQEVGQSPDLGVSLFFPGLTDFGHELLGDCMKSGPPKLTKVPRNSGEGHRRRHVVVPDGSLMPSESKQPPTFCSISLSLGVLCRALPEMPFSYLIHRRDPPLPGVVRCRRCL
jgi:hypothetical protein